MVYTAQSSLLLRSHSVAFQQIPKGLNCATLEGQRTINRARNRFNNICACRLWNTLIFHCNFERIFMWLNMNCACQLRFLQKKNNKKFANLKRAILPCTLSTCKTTYRASLIWRRLLNLKGLGYFFFQKVILFSSVVHHRCNICLYQTGSTTWLFNQHCGYWWPGALAPGHQ